MMKLFTVLFGWGSPVLIMVCQYSLLPGKSKYEIYEDQTATLTYWPLIAIPDTEEQTLTTISQ